MGFLKNFTSKDLAVIITSVGGIILAGNFAETADTSNEANF